MVAPNGKDDTTQVADLVSADVEDPEFAGNVNKVQISIDDQVSPESRTTL